MPRKAKRQPRGNQLILARAKRYAPVLEKLGIREAFAALPQRVRHGILCGKFSAATVVVPDAYADDPEMKVVAERVNWIIRQPTIDLLGDGTLFSPVECTEIVLPLTFLLRDLRNMIPASLRPSFERIAALTFDHVFDAAWEKTGALATYAVQSHARLDHRLYWQQTDVVSGAEEGCRGRLTVKLGVTKPRREDFFAGDERRHAWRAAIATTDDKGHWIRWGPSVVGWPEAFPAFNVYVQEHAMLRTFERLSTPKLAAFHAHNFMVLSLAKPEVVKRDPGGTVWIAVNAYERGRVGYLLADVVEQKVLVRTFLFLTMEGTPEGTKLRERLRADRRDIEVLRLDQLSTFVSTDVRNDPYLSGILRDCGCGHLLDLHDQWGREDAGQGQALFMRRYLKGERRRRRRLRERLTPSGEQQVPASETAEAREAA
jgi:hypothetical protein